MKRLQITLLISALSLMCVYAQEPCGTDFHHKKLEQNNPDYLKNRADIEQFTQNFQGGNLISSKNAAAPVVTIPVVVHILYNTSSQNLSDNIVESQIDVLNEDFRRLNSDTGQTRSIFQSDAGDPQIEFCLASKDPFGAATNGITRTFTTVSSFDPDFNTMKSTASGGKDPWPASDYLNIWVCALQGSVLGFAYFPGAPASIDGIVVHWEAFGSTGSHLFSGYQQGRTTTHEVGHYLNLYHTFENSCSGTSSTSCSSQGDRICDTPPVANATFGCPSSNPNTCTETPTDRVDQYENYMDYTYDFCKNMFSNGQISRMQALFSPGGARYSLTNSGGCDPQNICDNGASLPVIEDFESAFPPAGWDINNDDGSTTWSSASSVNGSGGSSTNAVIVDNFNYNGSGAIDDLTTFNIDLTGYSSASLSFDVAYARFSSSFFDGLQISVATDCNSFSNVVYDKSGSVLATTADQSSFFSPSSASDWRNEVINLDPYVGNIVRIRFSNINGWGNTLYLDNINISGTALACLPPENLQVTNITSSAATLNWDGVVNANSYKVRGRALNTSSWVNLNVSGTSYTASNIAGYAYEWQVLSVCDGGATLSGYSVLDTFGVGCHAPIELWTDNISSTSAVLNWTPISNAFTYIVKGRRVGTNGWISLQVLSNSYLATGLLPGATFEWQVKSNCLNQISGFSYLTPFTTTNSPQSLTISDNREWTIAIHPNPAANTTVLFIRGFADDEVLNVDLYNSIGSQVIHTSLDTRFNESIELDLVELPKGVYICKVSSSGREQISKLVVR